MKKLTLLTIILFAGAGAFAQKFELGVNNGISYNSLVSAGRPYLVKGWSPQMNYPMWSISAARVTGKWMIGVAMDYGCYSLKVDQPILETVSIFSAGGTFVPGDNLQEKF